MHATSIAWELCHPTGVSQSVGGPGPPQFLHDSEEQSGGEPGYVRNDVMPLPTFSLLKCMGDAVAPRDPPKRGCLCENAMERPYGSLGTSPSHFRIDIGL
jgi:hypothetical protein